jgi:hypothetical protein
MPMDANFGEHLLIKRNISMADRFEEKRLHADKYPFYNQKGA